jgi:SAM-dependent methyltransferase
VNLISYNLWQKFNNNKTVRFIKQLLCDHSSKFNCPICNYIGPFLSIRPKTGKRYHAQCPQCGAFERHRLQQLTLNILEKKYDFSTMHLLHFAPEHFFSDYFKQRVRIYETADLLMNNVDYQVDITSLPFNNETFDVVFASHVLEHVKDDEAALKEIARILTYRGIAILPVPILAETTIEYPIPVPFEAYHVRAPGKDYFNKYKKYFSTVIEYCSEDFDDIYQTYVYENRYNLPNNLMPYRPSLSGIKHSDCVPLCIK